MTAKKRPSLDTLRQENTLLIARIENLERECKRLVAEANDRIGRAEPGKDQDTGEVINGMARQRGDGSFRRHATRSGPNSTDDIFPPGCGPMELVWSVNESPYAPVIIGWQGDSFHTHPTKMAAVSWLLGIAQRIINDKTPER